MKTCSICGVAKDISEYYPNYTSSGVKTFCKVCANDKRRYDMISSMLSNSRQRAKRNGLEHDLDKEFLLSMREAQGNRCALSGWELDWDHTSSGKRMCPPNRASIDRIDSDKGYTKDNVQLLADAVNRIKSAYPQELFLKLCQDVAERSITRA